MLVVAGGKHSPGTTTLAQTIATIATAGLLVEADPSGGDLAARTGLSLDPGLASLTVAARTGLTHRHLAEHVQTLPSGIQVLVSPVALRHAISTITTIGGPLAALLHQDNEGDGGLTVVDVGRVDTTTLVEPLLNAADRVLFVTGGNADDIAGARSRVDMLGDHARAVTVVVTGHGGFALGEISAALAVPDVVRVPWDPRAVAAISTGRAFDRWTARSAYVRAVAHLTHTITAASTGHATAVDPPIGTAAIDTTVDANANGSRVR